MRKLLIVIALLIVFVVHHSCGKSDDYATIVLLGDEHYVMPVNSFIYDSLQTTIDYKLGTMPRGYIPCCVEGEYVIKPKHYANNVGVPVNIASDIHFRITNQHNRIAKVELNETGKTVVADTAYLMGNGQRFTLYFKESRPTSNIILNRSVIITGEKTDAGIKDVRFTAIILESEQGQNQFVGSFTPGWYFIYKDENNLAANCEWFDNN